MANRKQVLAVVMENMIDILEVDRDLIDPQKSMVDLGANSLDIVEVVSCSMRELRVKVPRSELSKLTNVNGLVDLLVEVSEEKARSA